MDEFLSKALHVPNCEQEIDLSAVPSSGEEYLKRVIFEARRCEPVVVAKIDRRRLQTQTVNFTNDTGCSPAPEGYAPQIEWQQARVVEFSALRKQISDQMMYLDKKGRKPVSSKALPNIDQEDRWLQLIYGKTPENGDTNSLQMSPFLSIILSLNQHEVEQLIEYHVRWMEERGFTKHCGCWMYALLVKLEKPLTPEMCSLLRNLARLCSKIRCDLMSADNPLLPQLNLFICLVGRYFDQSDLADK